MAVLSWVPHADTHPPLPLTQGSEDTVTLLLPWEHVDTVNMWGH